MSATFCQHCVSSIEGIGLWRSVAETSPFLRASSGVVQGTGINRMCSHCSVCESFVSFCCALVARACAVEIGTSSGALLHYERANKTNVQDTTPQKKSAIVELGSQSGHNLAWIVQVLAWCCLTLRGHCHCDCAASRVVRQKSASPGYTCLHIERKLQIVELRVLASNFVCTCACLRVRVCVCESHCFGPFGMAQDKNIKTTKLWIKASGRSRTPDRITNRENKSASKSTVQCLLLLFFQLLTDSSWEGEKNCRFVGLRTSRCGRHHRA
eukprot:6492123-Amphidinium_carterae.1